MLSGCLACIDLFGGGGGKTKKLRIAQVIVDHHIGTLQTLASSQRQQSRIAGTSPDQIADPVNRFYGSGGFVR